jgi:hypothetical protein
MVTNATSPVVNRIRENWESGNLLNMDAAMQVWTALVTTDAIWDFKVDIKASRPYADDLNDVLLGGHLINYDAIANIHYGFVGRAAGFSNPLLVVGAGAAQYMRWINTGNPDDHGECNFSSFCDHPFATWSINFGSFLYDLYKDRFDELNNDTFAQALEWYIELYGLPPDPPPGSVPSLSPSPSAKPAKEY